jgi:hypothetical protein
MTYGVKRKNSRTSYLQLLARMFLTFRVKKKNSMPSFFLAVGKTA